MTLRAIDCQSFAGGFTLGTVQAGFELVGKRELPGGFGVASCEANRHILGNNWETQVGPWNEWEVKPAEYVFGNPPCSGFSLMSASTFRGIDSPVNSCMFAFVEYAARVNPLIAVFESVQQAYTQGRPLMQNLRALLEARTGQQWHMYHVLHNAYCVGGCAVRRRYFIVFSRIPFGVERFEFDQYPTLWDAIGDLEDVNENTWASQPYGKAKPSWWSAPLRNPHGTVDGFTWRNTPLSRRAWSLLDYTYWLPDEPLSYLARRVYKKTGTLPSPYWDAFTEKLVSTDFAMGFNQMMRWNPDSPSRVITGAAPQLVVHPTQNRLLTLRECARIMGFPDDWRIEPLKDISNTPAIWGKGITTAAGRWISTWVAQAIDGWHGKETGTEIGERENLIDHTWSSKRAQRIYSNRTIGRHQAEDAA